MIGVGDNGMKKLLMGLLLAAFVCVDLNGSEQNSEYVSSEQFLHLKKMFDGKNREQAEEALKGLPEDFLFSECEIGILREVVKLVRAEYKKEGHRRISPLEQYKKNNPGFALLLEKGTIPYSLSIQNLIDERIDIFIVNGVLNLSKLDITALDGLQNISNITALKTLNLADNQITTINQNIFTKLTSLRQLDLSDNQIIKIGPGVFNGLLKLEELFLYGNKIVEIDAEAFTGLRSLQKLWLNNNEIIEIDPRVFTSLVALKTLNLADNQIAMINKNMFANQRLLEELVFDGNKIRTINPNMFEKFRNLKKLYLDNNELSLHEQSLLQKKVAKKVEVVLSNQRELKSKKEEAEEKYLLELELKMLVAEEEAEKKSKEKTVKKVKKKKQEKVKKIEQEENRNENVLEALPPSNIIKPNQRVKPVASENDDFAHSEIVYAQRVEDWFSNPQYALESQGYIGKSVTPFKRKLLKQFGEEKIIFNHKYPKVIDVFLLMNEKIKVEKKGDRSSFDIKMRGCYHGDDEITCGQFELAFFKEEESEKKEFKINRIIIFHKFFRPERSFSESSDINIEQNINELDITKEVSEKMKFEVDSFKENQGWTTNREKEGWHVDDEAIEEGRIVVRNDKKPENFYVLFF